MKERAKLFRSKSTDRMSGSPRSPANIIHTHLHNCASMAIDTRHEGLSVSFRDWQNHISTSEHSVQAASEYRARWWSCACSESAVPRRSDHGQFSIRSHGNGCRVQPPRPVANRQSITREKAVIAYCSANRLPQSVATYHRQRCNVYVDFRFEAPNYLTTRHSWIS